MHLQWNEALKPKQWFFKEKTIDPNCLNEANDYFRKSRNHFFESRLRIVESNQRKGSDGSLSDYIDVASDIYSKEGRKVCNLCNELMDSKLCKRCGVKETKKAKKGSYFEALPESLTSAKCHPYNHFAMINSPNDVKVTVDEPDMLNPNSYANITTHIKRTGKRAGIENYSSGKRKWMFFETDATIYRTLLNIIKNSKKCSCCEASFNSKKEFQAHDYF